MKPAALLCIERGIEALAEALLDRADIELIAGTPAAGALLEAGGIPRRALDEQGAGLPGAEHLRRCAAANDLRLLVIEEAARDDARALLDTAARLGIPALVLSGDDLRNARAAARCSNVALDLIDGVQAATQPPSRFPEWESSLAAMTPDDAARVLVAGRAARHVADALAEARPRARVDAVESVWHGDDADYDAVALSDPVPCDARAYALLRAAAARISPRGAVVAAYRSGLTPAAIRAAIEGRWAPPRRGYEAPVPVGEHTPAGIEALLSRCDLEPATSLPVHGGDSRNDDDALGWVTRAAKRDGGPCARQRERAARKARADALNREGETLFGQGDLRGAVEKFIEAAETLNTEPLYFNNLGAALHAAGRTAEAWDQFVLALHLDPNLPAARENLRAVAAQLGRAEEAAELLTVYGRDPDPEPPDSGG